MTIRLPQPGRTLDEVCTELESNTAGSYPVGVNGMPHQGVHIPGPRPIHAIASGTLVAYRLRKRLQEMRLPGHGHEKPSILSDSFALLKHDYVTPKGAQLSYYSLYMHLLPWGEEGDGEEASIPSALPAMTPEERMLSLFGARHYTVATEGLPGETDWQALNQSGPPVRGLVVYESSQPDATAVSFLERGATVAFQEPLVAYEALKNPSGRPLELADGGFIRPQAGDIEARPLIPHRVCEAVQNVSIPVDAGTLIGYPSPGFRGDYVHLEVMVPDITTLDSHKETWGQKVPAPLPPGSSYDAPSWFTQVKESMEPWTRVAVAGLLATLGIDVPTDIVQIGQALGYDPAIGPTLRKVATPARSEWDVATQTGLEQRLQADYKMTAAAAKVYAESVRAMSFLQDVNPPLPATTHHVHPITFIEKVGDLRGITLTQLRQIASSGGNRQLVNVKELLLPLNDMMERYEINASRERQCHFLAQVMVECKYLKHMAEAGNILWHKDPNLPSYKGYVSLYEHSLDPETERWYDEQDPLFAPYANAPLGNTNLRDAVKFRGRGLLQLTGRDHYARYWTYKGWIKPKHYTDSWWSYMVRPIIPGQTPFPSHCPPPGPDGRKILEAAWAPLWESYWDSVPTLRKDAPSSWKPADIPDPQKLSIDPECACDSAGWFWAKYKDLNTVVDEHYKHDADNDGRLIMSRQGWDNHVVTLITRAINGGENGLKRRKHAYHQIKKILMP